MDIELGLEMKANTELKKENRLLKSLLYCTTKSCNNCGKLNCETFQRQRKDCCENWVSYKAYIKELEVQIKVLAQNLEDTEICENGWKNRVKELEAQIEKMNELINRYYEVCVQIPKEYRTMVFDSCLEDTRQLRR